MDYQLNEWSRLSLPGEVEWIATGMGGKTLLLQQNGSTYAALQKQGWFSRTWHLNALNTELEFQHKGWFRPDVEVYDRRTGTLLAWTKTPFLGKMKVFLASGTEMRFLSNSGFLTEGLTLWKGQNEKVAVIKSKFSWLKLKVGVVLTGEGLTEEELKSYTPALLGLMVLAVLIRMQQRRR